MANLHHSKKGNSSFFFLLLIVLASTVAIKYYLIVDVTKYRKEFYEEQREVLEEVGYTTRNVTVPSREKLKVYRKENRFFSDLVYVVELNTFIKNEGTVAAKFEANHWVETLQDGILEGVINSFELNPKTSYELYSRIELPTGRYTEFPNKTFFGTRIKTPKLRLIKTETKCRLIPYTSPCILIFPDCKDEPVDELLIDCMIAPTALLPIAAPGVAVPPPSLRGQNH